MRSLQSIAAAVSILLVSATLAAGAPALTIYNQDFAVVRDTLNLELDKGRNNVSFSDVTAHLEPDSVILRDPAGQVAMQIIEQNYRADPVTQGLLLQHYEGQTIEFRIASQGVAPPRIVKGKIVRAGYQPHESGLRRYGSQYRQRQMARAYGSASQPIIETDGKLVFGLPGQPLFPALADDDILKPTLEWVIETDRDSTFVSEIAYLTGGMGWEADYNVIAPAKGDVVDLIGWVTMDNQSGKTFEQAQIKLLAGDVNKIVEAESVSFGMMDQARGFEGSGMRPPVSEQAFDEYHLYTLREPTTLRDRQTKQVEFVRAQNVKAQRLYVYDGAQINPRQAQRYRPGGNIIADPSYGTQANQDVWIMREFENSQANNLGIPLPAGRVRFYRSDDDRQLQFVGENMIDHTPKDEKVRVYTGNAFDLVGERRQKNFEHDYCHARETIEIKLRNHKEDEAVEMLVVEHLYRYTNWEIKDASHSFTKKDASTIEFPVTVKPDEEVIVTYTAHYYCHSTQKRSR